MPMHTTSAKQTENTYANAPAVSIVLAVYNGEDFLEEQLDSLAAQTHPFDELVIRDDGSTDKSVSIIKEWMTRPPGLNVRLLDTKENLGFIRNFCTLLDHASGDYIFLCDQDDRWHEDKLEVMVNAMNEHPEAMLIASSFEFMDAHSKIFTITPYKGWTNQNLLCIEHVNEGGLSQVEWTDILLHNGFQGCAMLIRKELARRYVEDENFILPHDWQLALLASLEHGLFYLDKPLFDYRIHSRNTTSLPQAQPQSIFEKVAHVFSHYYRTAPFRDRTNMLRSLERTAPELWTEQFERDMHFYDAYLKAIDDKSFSLYHKLMNTPEKHIMSYKDRIGGYLYILFGRKPKH